MNPGVQKISETSFDPHALHGLGRLGGHCVFVDGDASTFVDNDLAVDHNGGDIARPRRRAFKLGG